MARWIETATERPSQADFEAWQRVEAWNRNAAHHLDIAHGKFQVRFSLGETPMVVTQHGMSEFTDELAEALGWQEITNHDGESIGWRTNP